MLPLSTYVATCWRDGSSWTVQVPELGRTAQAARLSQVEGVARRLVAASRQGDPTSFRVVVEVALRNGLAELVAASAAARRDPDRVSVEAVTLRRGLAQRLADEGFHARDIAALLGLSYGRALQLVAEGSRAPRRPGARVGPHPTGVRAGGRARSTPAAPRPAVAPVHACPDTTGGSGMRPHRSFRHEALMYRGEREFLDGTAPFVREGVVLGQPVMVAVVPARLEALRARLGADANCVYWVDMAELGANPARIIPAWRQFVDEHGAGGRPVRGVGEPVWPGRRPAELVECQLHEALLNLAIEPDTPLWLRCPYDAAALDDDVLVEAEHSHPALVDGEQYWGSTRYGGADHASNAFGAELPEPPGDVEELPFDDASLGLVRRTVVSSATEAHLGAAHAADLAVAVGEVATNSVRHGGGRGCLRVWEDADALVCEVRDRGRIADLLAGRRMPSLTAEGGRGLWLVNQLSDLVQLRSSAQGSTVRVLSWLSGQAAGQTPRMEPVPVATT